VINLDTVAAQIRDAVEPWPALQVTLLLAIAERLDALLAQGTPLNSDSMVVETKAVPKPGKP
jgi:hypothetical protein